MTEYGVCRFRGFRQGFRWGWGDCSKGLITTCPIGFAGSVIDRLVGSTGRAVRHIKVIAGRRP
ncbi:hypothetical protein GCM10017778_08330 [Streptomyces vinaceus]|nr:hypothetical protein GCM10017778_08330 [Streptomyces vinaceus]